MINRSVFLASSFLALLTLPAAAAGTTYAERLVATAAGILAAGPAEADPAQAARLLEEAALAGNAEAMLQLAALCRSGTGVAADPARAEALLIAARDAGLTVAASLALGDLYAAPGPLQDDAKAEAAFAVAAEGGSGPAMIRLARLIMAAPGELPFNRLHVLLSSAVAAGEAAAGSEALGDLYLAAGPWHSGASAAMSYQRAADAGSVAASVKLAALLMAGAEVPADPARAATLIRAATAADRDGRLGGSAWETVGDLYAAAGEGRNLAAAASAYERASNAADASATVKLARLLMAGEGIAADLPRARALLDDAIAAGAVADGAAALGDLLSMEGPFQDLRAAANAYDAAGEAGNVEAMVTLAWIYAEGRGVEVSLGNAVGMAGRVQRAGAPGLGAELEGDLYLLLGGRQEWKLAEEAYAAAVGTGRPSAMVKLARLLVSGRVETDPARALALAEDAVGAGALRDGWATVAALYALPDTGFEDLSRAAAAYAVAANLGDAGAMLALGAMLAEGGAVPADLPRAAALFEQAVAAGAVAEGSERLGTLYLAYPAPGGDLRKALAYFNAAADAGSATAHLEAARLESLSFRSGGNRADMARHYREAARLLGAREVALEMMNIDAVALVAVTQQLLAEAGHPVVADGQHGPRTAAAIQAYCADRQLSGCEPAFVTVALLEALVGPPPALALAD